MESLGSINDEKEYKSRVKRQVNFYKEPKKKYSISRVEKEFTQLSKIERQEFMIEEVDRIFRDNQEYFTGRDVLFERNSSYFQCLSDPASENYYIMAQSIKISQKLSEEKDASVTSSLDDIKLFMKS